MTGSRPPGVIGAAAVYRPAVVMTSYFPARDGVRLAYREVGDGRPLILVHGLFGDGGFWLRSGIAGRIAAAGHRVILPDLRGHGDSARPREPGAWPPDVFGADGLALIEHLRLDDYDLGGYSLGARIAVRQVVCGAAPRRAVVAGQGLGQLRGGGGGGAADMMRRIFAGAGTWPPGSSEARTEQWLRRAGHDLAGLDLLMGSLVPTTDGELRRITMPVLVALGADDERKATADDLVALLPRATRVEVPGDHGTAVEAPELAAAIVDFLAGTPPDHGRAAA